MADERKASILLMVKSRVYALIKARTVASEIENRIQDLLNFAFTFNDSAEFRAAVNADAAELVENWLRDTGYQAGNPPDKLPNHLDDLVY